MLSLYYIAILISLIVIIDLLINDKKTSFMSILTVSIILIIIAGLKKVGVGFDDLAYVDIFQNIQYIASEKPYPMEQGYILQNLIVNYVSNNPYVLFITNALISIPILSYVCYKISPYPVLSLYLYFVHFFLYKDLTQFRNGIASSIIMLSVYLLLKSRYFLSTLSYLLSISYHIVAAVSIVPTLLPFVLKKNLKIIPIILFVCGIITNLLAEKLGIINVLSIIPIPYIMQKYYDYIISEYILPLPLFHPNNIRIGVIWLIGILFYRRLSLISKNFPLIFIFYSFGVFLRLGFLEYGIFSGRTASFFTQFDIILLCFYAKIVENFLLRIIIVFFIILYGLIILYNNLTCSCVINEYQNILLEEIIL